MGLRPVIPSDIQCYLGLDFDRTFLTVNMSTQSFQELYSRQKSDGNDEQLQRSHNREGFVVATQPFKAVGDPPEIHSSTL